MTEITTLPRPGERQTPWLDRAGAQKMREALRYKAQEALLEALRLPFGEPKEYAQDRACAALVALKQHKMPASPTPEDFESLEKNVLDIADINDAWMREIGEDANSSSLAGIDTDCFSGQFRAALVGNATHELEEAASDLREADDDDNPPEAA